MKLTLNFLNKTDQNNSANIIGKTTILSFVCIMIYQNLSTSFPGLRESNGYFNISSMYIILTVSVFVFIIGLLINSTLMSRFSTKRTSWLIETLVFSAIISIPLYIFGSYNSEFKYIFILLIITIVLQYGLRYGLLTAIFSTFLVLTVDLLYAPTVNGVNEHFQNDLIICGIFVFIAWVLGYHVELELERNRQNNERLNILNAELEEIGRHRPYMEEMLLKNKLCYDMLFENSLRAILVHMNDKIIYANESAAKLLGYKNSLEVTGISVYNHYPKDYESTSRNLYNSIIEDKTSKNIFEEHVVDKNGSSITVRNTSSYFVYEGSPAVLTLLLDITSEKQIETLKKDVEDNVKLLEETREFNNLITEFFTNISHELKTPINVIYLAIQTMEMYLCSGNSAILEKGPSYLKMMRQNCFRLMRLINNLLDITKLDSGFLKLNSRNDNIVNVVEDITLSVVSYVKSKDIDLIFDTNVEEKIMAFDHDKIERILLNLLSNASKFTPSKGSICVMLEDKGDNITISIKDTGVGIPKDKLDFVFQRFGQANRSLSREHEGTGIGLSLVKSFTQMHGGKIEIFSEEGQGTEFLITLPVVVNNGELDSDIIYETNVERINIEFSDIYSLNSF